MWVLGANLGPLEEREVALAAEPSPQASELYSAND